MGHDALQLTDREAAAESHAAARRTRDRMLMRPVASALIALVVVSTVLASPPPSGHGTGVWIVIALAVFTAGAVGTMRVPRERTAALTGLVLVMGGAGVALGGLQPHGATELGASAAVFTAAVLLPLRWALAAAALITVALDVVGALRGATFGGLAASTLLCVLLTLMARLLRSARESENRAAMLYAQLQDARDAQAEAAAVAERGRIAAELHDVLAHSLSGAAIQLQGARKLLERQEVDTRATAAVSRAAELVREGLGDARRAVAALHGEDLPTVDRLPVLVEDFRRDHGATIELEIDGAPGPLSADANLALYRGAQEALTNAARYAPGAPVQVRLRRVGDRVALRVVNGAPAGALAVAGGDAGLASAGGGHGLAGMRERITRLGGTMTAGATTDGWEVELEVPQ